VKNQLKFLTQEIVFFDKHSSRMYSKIMAIAPLYALHPDNSGSKDSFKYFQESVCAGLLSMSCVHSLQNNT
jgi:hypothetical protein